jgi:hypothetical protein
LNVLLKLDEKDHQIFEAEPDEGDAAPERKDRDRER